MTYLLLNSAVFLVIIGTLLITKNPVKWNKAQTWTLIILVIATALFDSLIIWARIVEYDESLITGLKVGMAPIEDFFYTIASVVMVPGIWHASKKAGHE